MATLYDEFFSSDSGRNFLTQERIKQLALERATKSAQQIKDEKKKDGNFLTSLLPTIGGAAGGIGGGAAAGALAGTGVLPGIGTAVGGLLGAILGGAGGSALGKVGQNAMEGEKDLGKDVLGEAALGGVTSLPLGASLKLARAGVKATTGVGKQAAGDLVQQAGMSTLPKSMASRAANAKGAEVVPDAAAPLRTSFRGRATDVGNQALLSQYGTISKPVARATNPTRTVGELADAGIIKPTDVERVGSAITGGEGMVNKAVVNAVGNAGGVDTSTLRQVFNDAMDNYGIVDTDRKSLTQVFDAQMKKLTGGARGSLKPLANPTDALDMMKSLEKRMADLAGKGSNYRLTTPERGDKANALRLVRDELEDKLYAGAGANAQLSNVLTPQFRDEVLALMPNNPKWAAYVDGRIMGAQSIGELRSSMAPFVRATQMLDEADINALTFGGRAGDALANGGVKNALVGAGTNLVKNPAARVAGTTLRRFGGAGDQTGQTLLGALLRQGGGRLVANGLQPGEAQAMPSAPDELGLAPEDYQTLANEGVDPGALMQGAPVGEAPVGQEAPNAFGVGPDEVAREMTNALKAGDKETYGLLRDLYETIIASEQSSTKVNATTQKALAQSANADTTLAQLEGLLANAGGAGGPVGGRISSFMGSAGLDNNAKTYNDLVNGSVTQIAKALGETGAMSDADRAAYMNLLPKITDTPEVAAQKFNALRARMAAAKQNTMQFGSGEGLEDALLAAGY